MFLAVNADYFITHEKTLAVLKGTYGWTDGGQRNMGLSHIRLICITCWILQLGQMK